MALDDPSGRSQQERPEGAGREAPSRRPAVDWDNGRERIPSTGIVYNGQDAKRTIYPSRPQALVMKLLRRWVVGVLLLTMAGYGYGAATTYVHCFEQDGTPQLQTNDLVTGPQAAPCDSHDGPPAGRASCDMKSSCTSLPTPSTVSSPSFLIPSFSFLNPNAGMGEREFISQQLDPPPILL